MVPTWSKRKTTPSARNGMAVLVARFFTMSLVACSGMLTFFYLTGERSLTSRFMLKTDLLEHRFRVQPSIFEATIRDNSSDKSLSASASAIATSRLCTSEELRFGEFRKTTLDGPLYIPPQSKCYTQDYLQSAKEWTDYRWHPFPSKAYHSGEPAPGGVPPPRDMDDMCEFSPDFTTDDYCRLANRKTIGFLGDSLSWEHFASLAGRLGRTVGPHNRMGFTGDDGKHYDQKAGIILNVCGGTSKIAFIRNQYAVDVQGFLNMTMADVVVFNTGAHGKTDDHLIDDPPRKGVKGTIRALAEHQERKQREEGRNFLSIWRTTSPGHHSCMNFSKPVNNYKLMEDHILNKANYPNQHEMRRNRWFDYQRRNHLVVQAFVEYNQGIKENKTVTQLNYEIMHAYEVMLLRPDGHVSEKDCLHNCDPGAVDVYNVLLLHLLRLHESNMITIPQK